MDDTRPFITRLAEAIYTAIHGDRKNAPTWEQLTKNDRMVWELGAEKAAGMVQREWFSEHPEE